MKWWLLLAQGSNRGVLPTLFWALQSAPASIKSSAISIVTELPYKVRQWCRGVLPGGGLDKEAEIMRGPGWGDEMRGVRWGGWDEKGEVREWREEGEVKGWGEGVRWVSWGRWGEWDDCDCECLTWLLQMADKNSLEKVIWELGILPAISLDAVLAPYFSKTLTHETCCIEGCCLAPHITCSKAQNLSLLSRLSSSSCSSSLGFNSPVNNVI